MSDKRPDLVESAPLLSGFHRPVVSNMLMNALPRVIVAG